MFYNIERLYYAIERFPPYEKQSKASNKISIDIYRYVHYNEHMFTLMNGDNSYAKRDIYQNSRTAGFKFVCR